MYPVPLVFTASAAVSAADPVWEFTTPHGFTVVGLSLCGQSFGGAPTSWNIDVVDDGADVISAAASHTAAGTPGVWKSKHVGGAAEPVAIAAGSVVGVALNVVGGSSPTVSKLAVIMWTLPGAV